MNVKLLTKQQLEFQNLKGGCTGSSESTLVKMPHCWKSRVAAHMWNVLYLLIIDKCTAREEPSVLALAQNGHSNQHGSSILRFLDRKTSSSRDNGEKTEQRKCLFVLLLYIALRPKSTALVMAGLSVHLTTLFPLQPWTSD